jgi:hypothetical protein
MKYFLTITVLLTSTLLTSCKKNNDNNPPADTAAVITINTPAANTHFPNASPLQIRGSVNDADLLKSVKVEVKNKTTGAVYYTSTAPISSITQYNFDWTYTVSGFTTLVTATIKITSTDQYDYTSTKEIDVFLEN